MGKRSEGFEPSPRGFYPTPWEAFEPLIPMLPFASTVAEPCAGDGALCGHLERGGIAVQWAADIAPRHPSIMPYDATLLPPECAAEVDMFVTNPPWPEPRRNGEPTLSILNHLCSLRPTWALLPSDFMHNVYAAPLMRRCSAIVSIGRVKWIPNTPHTGKENCMWALFNGEHSDGKIQFHPRRVASNKAGARLRSEQHGQSA